MSFSVYHNPTDVTIGGVTINGVQSVVMSSRYNEYKGVDDSRDRGRTTGVLTVLDQPSIEAAAGATGELEFAWTNQRTGAAKRVVLEKCTFGGFDPATLRDTSSAATLPFMADSIPVAKEAQ